ncbi:MAG: dienelactone hydrolase family protein [Gemmatimonadota bacterium]|nr:dienelactone hydrolase family protein [Gemmatimonadota bacterium]
MSLVSLLALLAASCASPASMADALVGAGPVVPGATVEVPIQVAGLSRRYVVHVPPLTATQLADQAHPLMLLLPGSSQVGETVMSESGMDTLSDARHFLLVYPDGVGGNDTDWNAGDCCGAAHAQGVDDVAFLQAVIADVASRFRVDTHRIYFAGFSDGARMAYSVACRMGATVAGVAAVSGSLTQSDCQPGRAIPVIAFHGVEDTSVPYTDPSHTAPSKLVKSALELPPTILFWLANNGCSSVTTAVYAQQGPVLTTQGNHCAGDVEFYTITNGTHTWPSPERGLAVDASPLIVDFLLAHTAP